MAPSGCGSELGGGDEGGVSGDGGEGRGGEGVDGGASGGGAEMLPGVGGILGGDGGGRTDGGGAITWRGPQSEQSSPNAVGVMVHVWLLRYADGKLGERMQFVAAGSTVHRPEVTVKYCALVKPTIMSRKAPHVGESILSEANARINPASGGTGYR